MRKLATVTTSLTRTKPARILQVRAPTHDHANYSVSQPTPLFALT